MGNEVEDQRYSCEYAAAAAAAAAADVRQQVSLQAMAALCRITAAPHHVQRHRVVASGCFQSQEYGMVGAPLKLCLMRELIGVWGCG